MDYSLRFACCIGIHSNDSMPSDEDNIALFQILNPTSDISLQSKNISAIQVLGL